MDVVVEEVLGLGANVGLVLGWIALPPILPLPESLPLLRFPNLFLGSAGVVVGSSVVVVVVVVVTEVVGAAAAAWLGADS